MSFNDIFNYIQGQIDYQVDSRNLEYKKEQELLKAELDKEFEASLNQKLTSVQKEVNESFKGKLLTFKIEERKKILAAKKNIIKAIEEKLILSFRSFLGASEYYNFIKNKIVTHALENDTVYLSKEDQGLVSKLQSDIGKNLLYKQGDFSSGLVIENQDHNFNYSLESLVESKSQEIQQLIWAKLHVLG